ncbi:hypothetical protein BJF83_17330 [Nocardiopsis sp. CNR-923]|nr:hypothetical protein BJF83_17330 [Nocardiopsis sp. CNR-923]
MHVAGSVYAPGDVPPPEVAKLITNPKAWEGSQPPAAAVEPTPDMEDDQDDGTGDDEAPERPAKSATVEAWREYILAVADIDEADVADMTKAQLQDLADEIDADTGDE